MTTTDKGAHPPILDMHLLDPAVIDTASPFFEPVIDAAGDLLRSIAVVGSAVTPDYRPGVSDVNSVFVLDRIDVDFLDDLANLGKSAGKKGIAIPLLMTPLYIKRSLDVFPLEFLEFRYAHVTVFGDDYLADLAIGKDHVRLAAERELKSLAINLRRGYLSCLGRQRHLAALLVSSLNSVVPVLRGILFLKDAPPLPTKAEIIARAAAVLSFDAAPFEKILSLRDVKPRYDWQYLQETYKGLYDVVQILIEQVDRF